MAAIAVGRQLDLDFATCAAGLAHFRALAAALKMGEFNGLTVIDDYAHHPTEIKKTIGSCPRKGLKI